MLNIWFIIYLLPLKREEDHSSFDAQFCPLEHEIEKEKVKNDQEIIGDQDL